MSTASRVSFIAEYYDPQAALTRTYQLFYCEADNSVEMHDLKNKRIFLKRCPLQNLSPKEVFLGATVTVYGRQLHLVDYADQYTRNLLESAEEEAYVEVSGQKGMLQVGNVITAMCQKGLRVANIVLHNQQQPVFAIGVAGTNASNIVTALESSFPFVKSTRTPQPGMFRLAPRTNTPKNTSVCVVKPHVILAGQGGEVVQRLIDEGFELVSFTCANLGQCDAEDFFEVYKTVVPEYKKLVEHMASGPCWAIEVRAENSVSALRAVCGPHDPEISRVLFPTSIRAKYGEDRVKNAVHCTDLQEESVLESEFFFSLLAAK